MVYVSYPMDGAAHGLGERLAMQCAGIPYRKTVAGDLEILLVTSRGKGHWILPKGKVKPGKTAAVSAEEEVYEEAGVRGMLSQALVARFDLPVLDSDAGEASEQMQVFSLEVSMVAATWPEMFQRQRRWVNLREAAETVKGGQFRKALRSFAAMMAPVG